ncbi:hypothetical protein CTI12_AA234750 [Artemisia annua]|uniref:O-fucosyltransferase family protein n=1 Tax=Artemisia annua TaxID=35608 RepID=A0A2U1NSW5_ARTAN|nr:hypothetical protein CTI12_AA234750 [Artemisia annua]
MGRFGVRMNGNEEQEVQGTSSEEGNDFDIIVASYIGIEILQGVILCHRRRVHDHHLLPFISSVAACILFFFAVLSFLSPPIHNHHFRHSFEEVGSSVGNPTAFLVPVDCVVLMGSTLCSNFSEIFDVDWFISYLSKDVKIVKELPAIGGKVVSPYRTRVPRKCNQGCYQTRMVPLLNKKKAVMLTKFDYRLSNRLATHLQKLRCRANYHALKFTDPIVEMGKVLVERMRKKSKHFIALHLRYESDMLAFSGCYYGGGDKERVELRQIRRRWKTLHKRNPDRERRQGRCPLTPEEVGLMLRALGYSSDVHIYVASGEVYGGEDTLAPLKALFPNIHSKDTLTTKDEMAPFLSYSARMAALDFIVCDESDVFVTNNNGNMAKMLAGRRRYFGHKPTIRPNAKKLWRLFVDRNNMTWEEFANTTRSYQVGFMGQPNEVKPGTGEFHENPVACICEKSEAMSKSMIQSNHFLESDETNYVTDEEHDGSDDEDVENENRTRIQKLVTRDGTGLSHIAIPGASEIDEIFSD